MTRTHPRDWLALDLGGVDGHHLPPVLPVTVGDLQRDGRSKREAATNPGDDVRDVLLDRHPSAAAMTALPAAQVRNQVLFADRETGRNAVQNDRQSLTMRLTRGQQTEAHACTPSAARSSAARIAPSGARPPAPPPNTSARGDRSQTRPSPGRRTRTTNT